MHFLRARQACCTRGAFRGARVPLTAKSASARMQKNGHGLHRFPGRGLRSGGGTSRSCKACLRARRQSDDERARAMMRCLCVRCCPEFLAVGPAMFGEIFDGTAGLTGGQGCLVSEKEMRSAENVRATQRRKARRTEERRGNPFAAGGIFLSLCRAGSWAHLLSAGRSSRSRRKSARQSLATSTVFPGVPFPSVSDGAP